MTTPGNSLPTRGYAATTADTPLAPFAFDRRVPGDRDVHITIDFCGICHSDIHSAKNEWGMTTYPFVPGHEIIGRVVKIGKDVKNVREGQRVGVGCFVNSCRKCGSCKSGRENYCENGMIMTYGSVEPDGTPTRGGYSRDIVVDEHFVLTIPEGLDPAGAAPLLCAGITTYSPLRQVGVTKGSRVAVMGLGGLGHMGVKLAASLGAEVTVFSRSPEKEADAKRLGANEFVLTTRPGALDAVAGRYDAVLDTVSAKHDLTPVLNALKAHGSLILVGASPEPLEFSALPLIFANRRIVGSLVGGIPETQELLEHCGKHGITSDVELITPDQINAAFERTLRGDVKYRFVIDCTKF
jgi:alcohol dehydrogenase (NADP+)